jgi:RNA polymerase sigma-70 factor (ECF subfamily)
MTRFRIDAEKRTDQEIVAATLKERDVFALLVGRYEQAIGRYIARLCSSDTDAVCDILQETFIKAYLHLNDYDPSLSFSAWLYRIAHNEAIAHFRKQKNRPRAFEHDDAIVLIENIAADLDLEAATDARMRSDRIRSALQTLDQRHRDILILRFLEEKSYDEISDILQMPHGTVATGIRRAKMKLKDALASEGNYLALPYASLV